MKRQDFERFLNERVHGVICAVCGRQDWMMSVNEENENILIMCSHCGHVVSFNRNYVETLLGEAEAEDLGSDGSNNNGSNADKPVDCRLADLPVDSGAELGNSFCGSSLGFLDRVRKTILNLVRMVKVKLYPL